MSSGSCFIRAPPPECWVNGLQSTEVPPYVLKDTKLGHMVPLINVLRSSESIVQVDKVVYLRWSGNINERNHVTYLGVFQHIWRHFGGL